MTQSSEPDRSGQTTLILPDSDSMRDLAVPIVVPPRQACRLLSMGLTRLYELLNKGELESYRDGRSRRITTESIRGYVERQIIADDGKFVAGLAQNRRRSR
jgi:excisionase family DNA binding protein